MTCLPFGGSSSIVLGTGNKIKLSNPHRPVGTVIYTIDGQDPRAIGGTISKTAVDGGDEFEVTVNQTTILKARTLNGTSWSALHEIVLNVNADLKNLKVTEIHYHPLDNGAINNSEYEFLELKNTGNVPLNLSSAKFVEGIDYSFPVGTNLDPNNFIVLASNKQEFNVRYSAAPFDEYGGQLDNNGEKIILVSAINDTVFSLKYDDSTPWPTSADGDGFSLVSKSSSSTGDLNDASNWRASNSIHGSPGKDDLNSSGIEEHQSTIPTKYSLNQNYPNPFNPETTISYKLQASSQVSLKVYDVLGNEIATLVNEFQQAGIYNSKFYIRNSSPRSTRVGAGQLPTGVYFYTLKADSYTETKKMILLK
ncbi:MAG: hypothetical protein FD122_3783 [Stygiobacter sp.]|nr:MAG: hypothetical protein FD122_3783 [Stygiobacter sp.]